MYTFTYGMLLAFATLFFFFFFNDTATTEIYTLSLHDALPICSSRRSGGRTTSRPATARSCSRGRWTSTNSFSPDRKSTRLNSSHSSISYAVFCLKKKKNKKQKNNKQKQRQDKSQNTETVVTCY